jgi:hypothetical protein
LFDLQLNLPQIQTIIEYILIIIYNYRPLLLHNCEESMPDHYLLSNRIEAKLTKAERLIGRRKYVDDASEFPVFRYASYGLLCPTLNVND